MRLTDNTEYGLVAYVFTTDLNRGIQMGERAGVYSNAAAPFGSVKQSGLAGKADSKASKNTFTPDTSASRTPASAKQDVIRLLKVGITVL